MVTLLVELKNEYTSQIVNILSPLIFQGIQSIYAEAQAIVKVNGDRNNTLKIFQSCLKSISDWNQITIENETIRIVQSSYIIDKFDTKNNYDWINNLVKATLKANIAVLMFNPCLDINKQITIDPKYYQHIELSYFIHRVYIECAIELWNNPYLLYHDYPPIEIKRNHRDCIMLIKDCIKETIRKLLPIKHILEVYLTEHNCKKKEKSNLLIENNLPIINENDTEQSNHKPEGKQNNGLCSLFIDENQKSSSEHSEINNLLNLDSPPIPKKYNESNDDFTQKEKDLIKNNIIPVSSTINLKTQMNNKSSLIKEKSHDSVILDIINNESTYSSNINFRKNDKKNKNLLDDKIKHILTNDLAIEDSETSLRYTQNNNFQAIFSNSNTVK